MKKKIDVLKEFTLTQRAAIIALCFLIAIIVCQLFANQQLAEKFAVLLYYTLCLATLFALTEELRDRLWTSYGRSVLLYIVALFFKAFQYGGSLLRTLLRSIIRGVLYILGYIQGVLKKIVFSLFRIRFRWKPTLPAWFFVFLAFYKEHQFSIILFTASGVAVASRYFGITGAHSFVQMLSFGLFPESWGRGVVALLGAAIAACMLRVFGAIIADDQETDEE